MPSNIFSSCGYAVHLQTNNIRAALDILEYNQIIARGVYLVEYKNGTINYRKSLNGLEIYNGLKYIRGAGKPAPLFRTIP